MATRQIQDGETVKLGKDDELVLKWSSTGAIQRIEIFPVQIGNMGSKHVLYQPEAMLGEMVATPLSSCDIYAVAYTDQTKKFGTYLFKTEVEGTHGFLFSLMACSGNGYRAYAGGKMEVDIGEPVNFYWKASPTATHANLTGVGGVDPKAGKASVIVKDAGPFTLSVDGGDSANADTQTIQIDVSGKQYEGYYDDNAQKLIEDNVYVAGLTLVGTDQDLLEGYWLTVDGGDGLSRFSAQIEKGTKVTLHFKVKEGVNSVEIYDGMQKIPDVPDTINGGEFDVEVEPKGDTDYVLTAFAKEAFTEGYKFARGVVHVGVHGEGEDVSEHRSNLPNVKFDMEKEWEIFKSPATTIFKYLKWQYEMGIKLSGAVEIENQEGGPALELGSTNGKSLALTVVKKWEEKHGDEYRSKLKFSPTSHEVDGDIIEYDKKENRLKVLAVTYEWTDGVIDAKIEGAAMDLELKEIGDIRLLEAEGTISAGLAQIDFEISEHVSLTSVQVAPYAKVSVWLDWRAACGEAIKDAAEDAAEDGAELAGAEVALVGGAVLICVAIVALAVMSILESADIVELAKEVVELTGDAKRGYLDGIAGSGGAGGYWYSRGKAVGEQVIADRKATLKGVPKNTDLADFDTRWDASWKKYSSNFNVGPACAKVIEAAKLSLWNGFGPKYIDTRWSGKNNNQMREYGWVNIYGGPPSGSAARQLFHKFDNEHTSPDNFTSDYRAKS